MYHSIERAPYRQTGWYLPGPSPVCRFPDMALVIRSAAFESGHTIPARHTCRGADVSPPLEWEGVPSGAQSLVLIVDDPDAPDPAAPKMTWVHWLLYNIPSGATGLPEGATDDQLPEGTLQGTGDSRRTGYSGPCPPVGQHRYFHKLYALDRRLPDLDQPTKQELLNVMEGHVIAQAELVGLFP